MNLFNTTVLMSGGNDPIIIALLKTFSRVCKNIYVLEEIPVTYGNVSMINKSNIIIENIDILVINQLQKKNLKILDSYADKKIVLIDPQIKLNLTIYNSLLVYKDDTVNNEEIAKSIVEGIKKDSKVIHCIGIKMDSIFNQANNELRNPILNLKNCTILQDEINETSIKENVTKEDKAKIRNENGKSESINLKTKKSKSGNLNGPMQKEADKTKGLSLNYSRPTITDVINTSRLGPPYEFKTRVNGKQLENIFINRVPNLPYNLHNDVLNILREIRNVLLKSNHGRRKYVGNLKEIFFLTYVGALERAADDVIRENKDLLFNFDIVHIQLERLCMRFNEYEIYGYIY